MRIKNTLVLLLSTFSFCTAQPIKQQLDALLQEYNTKGFRGNLLVYSKGEVLFNKACGYADPESKRAQEANTPFTIGSVTKQFTAAGILVLEQEGKIRVGDKITKYFGNVPPDKSEITLHEMLTHTAGFDEALGDDYDTINADAFITLAMSTPLKYAPGSQYFYTNVGYSLLGIIIEKVSGMGYEKFLNSRLFVPSGMLSTGYLIPNFDKRILPVGYRGNIRWGTFLDQTWAHDGPGWHLRGNGGIISTASDMLKWYKSLRNNTVLNKTETAKYFTPYVAEGPKGQSFYAYGWVIQKIARVSSGETIIWHNGGNGIFNANMTFSMDSDWCVIAASNEDAIISDNVARRAIGILSTGKIKEPDSQQEENPDPMVQKIYDVITTKGADYYSKNFRAILKEANFDFVDDMVLLNTGQKFEDAKKWEEGIALYESCTVLFPNIVIGWNRLGVCHLQQGHKDKARACWEQSLKVRSENNRAYEFLKLLDNTK